MTAIAPSTARHVLTLAELDANPWCSCGPAALAALLGRSLVDVRHAFPNQQEGRTYTTFKHMLSALARLEVPYASAVTAPIRASWPKRGLVIVQFNGSWDAMPVNHPAQLQRTHWIAVDRDDLVFDVNMVDDGFSGWSPRFFWVDRVAPWLAKSYGKKATGAWWVRAGIEVR